VASLDPLARREFLQDLMEAVAEHELSVILSSHLVSDLERVCDHLIVLVDSRVPPDTSTRSSAAASASCGRGRAGRPVAGGLGSSAYAVAMVHDTLGDDERRTEWLHVTEELGVDPARLVGCRTGWAPTFDALLALDRDDPAAAVERLAADLDDPEVWRLFTPGMWRPWYAALWAEAAVLGRLPDAAERVDRSRQAARDNPIATAIVERAAAVQAGDRTTLDGLAATFTGLGCPYQHDRTLRVFNVT